MSEFKLNETVETYRKKHERSYEYIANKTNETYHNLYNRIKNDSLSGYDLLKIGKHLDIDLNKLKDLV